MIPMDAECREWKAIDKILLPLVDLVSIEIQARISQYNHRILLCRFLLRYKVIIASKIPMGIACYIKMGDLLLHPLFSFDHQFSQIFLYVAVLDPPHRSVFSSIQNTFIRNRAIPVFRLGTLFWID